MYYAEVTRNNVIVSVWKGKRDYDGYTDPYLMDSTYVISGLDYIALVTKLDKAYIKSLAL